MLACLPELPAVLLLLLQLLQPAAAANPPKRTVWISDSPSILVPLTPANFSDVVAGDLQAWVLHFHSGSVPPQLLRLADEYRGLLRFGGVDKSAGMAADFEMPSTAFRALPFGSEQTKRSEFLDTDVFAEAARHAAASVPDSVARVVSEKDLAALVAAAANSQPPRFTVIFTIRDSTPTLLQRVLSKKLERHFNFGVVPRAAGEAAAKLQLKLPVPGLAVLLVLPSGQTEIVRFDQSGVEEDTELSYREVLRFLVELNRELRPRLLGSSGGDAEVLLMQNLLRDERLQFEIVDFQDAAAQKPSHGEL